MKKILFLCLLSFLLTSFCGGKKEKTLYIFNWTDYIAPELIKKFETSYDCKVVYDMFNSNENMLTKVLTAQAMYDIIVPTGDHVEIMKNKDLIEKLDKSKIPNWKNLDASLMKKAALFDEGNEYGIPYFWGTGGFVYNKKHLTDEQMKNVSWDFISDSMFKGKNVISMLDDAREVVGVSLITAGHTPNTLSEEALKKAEELLVQWDKNISHYDSDSYKNEIQDETVWLAQSYNGDALQIMAINQDIGFALPKEGSTLWIDFLVVPKRSENKELAYQFINFMLEPENAKTNSMYVQYATPNREAMKLLPETIKNNPYIYPDSSYLKKCHLIKNIGDDVLKIDKIWQKIRNN